MNPWRHLACFPIILYRWTLSPLKRFFMGPGAGCRFHPTCSAYAMESIMQHGVWSGSLHPLLQLLETLQRLLQPLADAGAQLFGRCIGEGHH